MMPGTISDQSFFNKDLTGEDDAVKAYSLGSNTAQTFLQKYMDLLDLLIPLYEKEGKAYLTIAVGCTGGRQRSVAVARAIQTGFRATAAFSA